MDQHAICCASIIDASPHIDSNTYYLHIVDTQKKKANELKFSP